MGKSFLLVMFGISTSFASSKVLSEISNQDCFVMKNKQMELALISSNIENINTTRTPEGGPYKPKKLVCNEQMCVVVSYKGFISKLKPGHPDADRRGYVKFPKIDLRDQLQAMIDVRSEYEQAARNCKAIARR